MCNVPAAEHLGFSILFTYRNHWGQEVLQQPFTAIPACLLTPLDYTEEKVEILLKCSCFCCSEFFFFPQRGVLVHLPKTCLVGLWPCKDCLVIVNVCQVKYVQMIWRWSGFLFGQNDEILCTWHFWLRRNSHFFFFTKMIHKKENNFLPSSEYSICSP